MLERRSNSRTSLARRLLLAATSGVAAFVVAEIVYRCVEPQPPRMLLSGLDGDPRTAGEIMDCLRRLTEAKRRGGVPSGGLPPGTRLRFGYVPRSWDYFDADGCIDIEFNQHGFHDLDFPVSKRPREFRVLAIGDSFTFGVGLPLELTWPQRLEALLRPAHDGPLEVINAGFAGLNGDASGYSGWLVSDGMRFAPDLVLVGFCLNDMGPVPMLSYPTVPRSPVLGGLSHLLDEIVRGLRQRAARNEDRSALLQYLEMAREFEQWKAAQKGLQEMQHLTAAHGVPMAVVVFPMLTELERLPFASLHAIVGEFCAQSGIRCLDLQDAFAGLVDEEFWVHPTDQHPNHVATRIIADRIHDYLLAERLVPR